MTTREFINKTLPQKIVHACVQGKRKFRDTAQVVGSSRAIDIY